MYVIFSGGGVSATKDWFTSTVRVLLKCCLCRGCRSAAVKFSPETAGGSRHGISGEILLFLFPQQTKVESAQNFSRLISRRFSPDALQLQMLAIFENPYGALRPTESQNPQATNKKKFQKTRKPRLSPKVNARSPKSKRSVPKGKRSFPKSKRSFPKSKR